jgi:hypothetical protein
MKEGEAQTPAQKTAALKDTAGKLVDVYEGIKNPDKARRWREEVGRLPSK